MRTPSLVNPDELLDSIQDKINAHRPTGYNIVLHRDDYRQDGDWWYVVVHPDKPDVRARDYTKILETIEEEIKLEQSINVLLVPTLQD
jgi:hypothetical protein